MREREKGENEAFWQSDNDDSNWHKEDTSLASAFHQLRIQEHNSAAGDPKLK